MNDFHGCNVIEVDGDVHELLAGELKLMLDEILEIDYSSLIFP